MPWTIEFLDTEQVILVTTSGSMDLNGLKRLAIESLAESNRRGASRFLLDHRKMTPAVDAVEVYNLPNINESLGVTRQHRIAIVYDPASSEVANFQFYEDRAYNVGFDHRLFTDIDKAKKWLTGAGDK